MDPQEVKDRLRSAINHIIKDEPTEASKELHDVLAAKMRDRISPPEEKDEEEFVDVDYTEDDDNKDPDEGK